MEALGRYILSVTSGAIILSILRSLLPEKSACAVLLQLIGGLFLSFTMLAPVVDLDLDHIYDTSWQFTKQGSAAAAEGHEISTEMFHDIIKRECEAYILDKAKSYDAQLEVQLQLSQAEAPIPASVELKGEISPFAKVALQQWLQDDMGIPKENQLWIG